MKPEIKMAITKSNHHMGLINQTPTTLGEYVKRLQQRNYYGIITLFSVVVILTSQSLHVLSLIHPQGWFL